MTDTTFPIIDEQGCLHITVAQQRDLLKTLGGLKASEYRFLLANGMNIADLDAFGATFAFGLAFMRRRNPTATFDALADLVSVDFPDVDELDDEDDAAVSEVADEPDPPIAAS